MLFKMQNDQNKLGTRAKGDFITSFLPPPKGNPFYNHIVTKDVKSRKNTSGNNNDSSGTEKNKNGDMEGKELFSVCQRHLLKHCCFPKRDEVYPDTFVLAAKKRDSDVEAMDNPVEYWRVYFQFGYFFLYLPFKYVVEPNSGWLKSTTSKYHKGLTAIIHAITLCRFAHAIREVKTSDVEINPSVYFELVRNCVTLVYITTFIISFWGKMDVFNGIVRDLQHCKVLTSFQQHRKFKIRKIATVLCITYTCMAAANILTGAGVLHIRDWSWDSYVRAFAGKAKFVLLLRDVDEPISPNEPLSLHLYLLAGFEMCTRFYYKLGFHYADLALLMCALVLRDLAIGFAMGVKRHDDFYLIFEQYFVLKEFARKINTAMGPVTLFCVVLAMPYYATHIGDILVLNDWFGKLRYIFFLVNFFSILIIASDTVHKVEDFRHWFSHGNNCMALPQSKVIVIVNELGRHPVGLSAYGLFTITFGFIGTMASVVITYAVIILQFRSSVVSCSYFYNGTSVQFTRNDDVI